MKIKRYFLLAHLLLSIITVMSAQTAKVVNAFYFSSGIVADSQGNLYVTGKNNKIIKIDPEGKAHDFAGSPRGRSGLKDDKGTAALFSQTKGIAIDGEDNLYIADYTTIRKVTPDGVVTTILGTNKGVLKDGVSETASFRKPECIAIDNTGTLYVTDEAYDSIAKRTCNVVRKVSRGKVTTIRNADGSMFKANWIYALACDKDRNLYVSAVAWSSSIVRITPEGIISTVAGKYDTNEKNKAAFKEGDVKAARFAMPKGIAIDKNGDIFFSDGNAQRIVRIANGQVKTVAGSGKVSTGSIDGKGLQAIFQNPNGIAFDNAGNLFIVDESGTVNSSVRKLNPDGIVTTFCKHYFNAATKQYEEKDQ